MSPRPRGHEKVAANGTLALEIRKFPDDAIKSGEFQLCDTGRLACAVAGMMNRSLLHWAIDCEGDVTERMRAGGDVAPRLLRD